MFDFDVSNLYRNHFRFEDSICFPEIREIKVFSAKELSRDVLTIFFGFARPVSCNSESEEIEMFV